MAAAMTIPIENNYKILIKHPSLDDGKIDMNRLSEISHKTKMLIILHNDTYEVYNEYLHKDVINELMSIGYTEDSYLISSIHKLNPEILFKQGIITKEECVVRTFKDKIFHSCSSLVFNKLLETGIYNRNHNDFGCPSHPFSFHLINLISNPECEKKYVQCVNELLISGDIKYSKDLCVRCINLGCDDIVYKMITKKNVYQIIKLVRGELNFELFKRIVNWMYENSCTYDDIYELNHGDSSFIINNYIKPLFDECIYTDDYSYLEELLSNEIIKLNYMGTNIIRHIKRKGTINGTLRYLINSGKFSTIKWNKHDLEEMYVSTNDKSCKYISEMVTDIDYISMRTFSDPKCLKPWRVNFLINHPKFNINLVNTLTTSKTSILMYFCKNYIESYESVFEYIFVNDFDIDINYENGSGYTLLSMACRYSPPRIISLILDYPGVDVNIISQNGFNAFIHALRYSTPEIVRKIIEFPNFKMTHEIRRYIGNNFKDDLPECKKVELADILSEIE
tara:strand:+ start:2115 stop:3638 length:1524 start_codon:yes stop_codon:yes gene_type:complete